MDETRLLFLEKDLLNYKNTNLPIGPFDGRVAALHPTRPGWYISSPNYDYIPLPPEARCNVYVRFDGRFGPDDHTQWPQPFSPNFPHLCCVPKKKKGDPHSIIWEDPQTQDFQWIQNDITGGLGKWSGWLLEALGKSVEWLLEEVASRRANNKFLDSHPEIVPLSTNLRRALSRLRVVPTSHRGAMISLRLVQRLWLELHGLMEYVCKYLPCMEGRACPLTETADVMGCFVHTAHSAERLFAAGIPYWLLRELYMFDKENILSIGDIAKPEDLLVVEDHPIYAPRIYQGDSNENRYRAICNHSLKYLRYADPFSAGLPRGICPDDFSQTNSKGGPSRTGSNRNHKASFQPYKKNAGSNSGRDKFELVKSPYMPFCLDAWREALQGVDRRPERLYFHEKLSANDGKYAFPEPGIFCSGDNASRRNQFLTIWETLQPVIINRMSSDLSSVTLLSNEQWRILLAGREPNEKSRRGGVRISIHDLLTPDAMDVGVELAEIHKVKVQDYSLSEARRALWVLSELSFRFDLVMLDRKALTARRLEDTESNRRMLSPMCRERWIMDCFPFGPSDPRHLAFVDPEHAKRGLASRKFRDRIPYLNALRRVMGEWDGYETHPIGRWKILKDDDPEVV